MNVFCGQEFDKTGCKDMQKRSHLGLSMLQFDNQTRDIFNNKKFFWPKEQTYLGWDEKGLGFKHC